MSDQAKKSCRCACGYRCGYRGRMRCELDLDACLEAGHFVRDCDHEWNGPMRPLYSMDPETGNFYESGGSVTCSVCGEDAMAHDCAVGP